MRTLIEDRKVAMTASKKDAGHTMFRAALVTAFSHLKAEKEKQGLKLTNEILEINVLTKDGYGITITGCDKADFRIGNFELVKLAEFGEWGAKEMLLNLLTKYMNQVDENGLGFSNLAPR